MAEPTMEPINSHFFEVFMICVSVMLLDKERAMNINPQPHTFAIITLQCSDCNTSQSTTSQSSQYCRCNRNNDLHPPFHSVFTHLNYPLLSSASVNTYADVKRIYVSSSFIAVAPETAEAVKLRTPATNAFPVIVGCEASGMPFDPK